MGASWTKFKKEAKLGSSQSDEVIEVIEVALEAYQLAPRGFPGNFIRENEEYNLA